MKYARTATLVAALVACVGCDPTYPISLKNGLGFPVTISVTYADGSISSGGALYSGQQVVFFHPESGGGIRKISIRRQRDELYVLDRQELEDMVESVDDPSKFIWVITKNGVSPSPYNPR